MNIEYERTMDDLIDFHLFHYAHSKVIRQQSLGWRILMTLFTVLTPIVVLFLLYRHLLMPVLVMSALGGALIFFLYPYLERRSIVGRLRKLVSEGDNSAILGHQAISLSPDGIFNKSQSGEGKLNWSSISKVTRTEKHIYLHIGAMNAVVVPTRAFASGAQREEFLSYVDAHLDGTAGSSRPPSPNL
jgi:hypothetical protein